MLNGYQVHSLTSDEQELHRNATIQLVRFTLAPELSMLLDSFSVLSSRNSQPVFQLQYDAKLRDAVLLLADNNKRDFHANATAIDWLNNLADSLNCSNSCRAWSCFLLGHLSLEKARKSGLLQRLWDQTKCPPTSSVCLEEARKHFTRALRLLGSSSGLLKRNVQRSLALANGPGKINSIDSLATFRLINSSIGFSVRRQMMKMMESNSCLDMQGDDNVALCSGEETTKLFMEKLEQVLPSSWRFVTAGLCPSGELLMTSVEIGDSTKTLTYRNACLFPESVQEKDAGFRDLFDEIVKPLNEFLFSNQAQLSEEDSVDNRNKTNVEGHARRWWNMRKECDEDLNALLFKVERVLLSTEATEEILLGSFQQEPCPVDHMSNVATPRRNLAARFDAASTNGDPGANRSNMDVDAKKDPKRQDVVKCSNDEADNGRNMKGNKSSRYTQKCYDHDEDNDCTFLILDENLQRFPFESLQCFNGRIICRLPSLSFALARLMKADNDEPADKHRLTDFNPSRISYILDPECNLNATQERLKPFLDSLNEKFENDWTAIVGESPSADFMERALSTADGLLLYFGHGGGQQYFSRSKIEALGRRRGCDLSSIILMGCSSGKLESVNTKNSTSVSKLPMHFEPEGLALSYLIAGAPCVVGNLWDVTDRDIDRFSVALLDGIFKDDNGTSQSIAICVAQARSACKMRYAVGCAPVCYGFPIRMQARKR